MAYTEIDFKSKKAVKEAIAAGTPVRYYLPGLGTYVSNGKVFLEGPHYPKPHSWYGEAVVKDDLIVSIK